MKSALTMRMKVAKALLMEKDLKTHYYFYSNEEGDGYEVYFCGYEEIRGFGDTYDDAYEEALEHMKAYLLKKETL